MSKFFISCKESRIENNRSFYGCFYLGPFEPSQSITIANTLRRTLLSEIYGLAIVSVEIEGALHEYSSLPGVRESVLDILLNLKEIVLKKTIKNFTPQIGYLRARGPGVVSAGHLKLPPFIQCVDPDQYIANLSHNGFLNMKFIIQYGNKWLAPITFGFQSPNDTIPFYQENETGYFMPPFHREGSKARTSLPVLNSLKNDSLVRGSGKDEKKRLPITYNVFNLYFKKRRLFLKKLKEAKLPIDTCSLNSYINMFSKNVNFSSVPLFKLKKKRDFVLKRTINSVASLWERQALASVTKSRMQQSLNLILKISRKYPGINLKNGPLFSKSYISNVSNKNKIKNGLVSPLLLSTSIYDGSSFFPLGRRSKSPGNKANVNNRRKKALGSATGGKKEDSLTILKTNSLDFIPVGKTKDKEFSPQSNLKNFNRQFIGESLFPVGLHSTNKSNSKLNSLVANQTLGSAPFLSEQSPGEEKQVLISGRTQPKKLFFNLNSLNIESIFNPISKTNYIIEINDLKTAQTKLQNSFKNSELYETLQTMGGYASFSKINLEDISLNKEKKETPLHLGSATIGKGSSYLSSLCFDFPTIGEQEKQDFEQVLQLNQEISVLTKETIKHNIILEIWTNGSIHPRDALFQAFKNIIKTFTQLKTVQPFSFTEDSLSSEALSFGTDKASEDKAQPRLLSSKQKNQFLVKKIKMGQLKSTFIQDLQPLNETSFLSTYIHPKLKNYYFNKQNLSIFLKAAIETNFVAPFYLSPLSSERES